jgi:haloacetate dehalogenase
MAIGSVPPDSFMDGHGTWSRIETPRVTFRVWHGGSGPAVLLLHGFPETARAWTKVVDHLCSLSTVIAPDLPGYGFSRIHAPDEYDYSKHSMAADLIALLEVMECLPVHVVGHDRGARVAYRMALDAPDAVCSLTVLGIVPTAEVLAVLDHQAALGLYHWQFLAQPAPLPEKLIAGNSDYFVSYTLDAWCGTPGSIPEDSRKEYMERFRDPGVVHAACQDYRAALALDAPLDAVDIKGGKRICCPTLVVWGGKTLGYVQDVKAVWQRWTRNLAAVELNCGHFVMEEQPGQTAELIADTILG